MNNERLAALAAKLDAQQQALDMRFNQGTQSVKLALNEIATVAPPLSADKKYSRESTQRYDEERWADHLEAVRFPAGPVLEPKPETGRRAADFHNGRALQESNLLIYNGYGSLE